MGDHLILQPLQIAEIGVATAIATFSAAVGALIVMPPSPSSPLPWYERARQVYPARIAPVIAVFILSQLLTVSTMLFFIVAGIVAPMSLFVVMGLSPLLGPIAVAMGMSWLVSPRKRPIGYWLAGCASALLFRFPNTLVYGALAALLFALPHDLRTVISVLVMGAGGLAFAAWGGGIWIARLLGLARPALPRVTYAADWAGERVGVRAAAVYELTWPRVRVDAFSFSRYLVVTDAAASLLSDEELFSLCIREVTFFQQRGSRAA